MKDNFKLGQDLALRDIVRVAFPDGSRAVGRVIALFEAPGRPPRATVDTPRGEWSGLAREAVMLRHDETNRRWRDGEGG